MKKICLTLLCLITGVVVFSQNMGLNWVHQVGSSQNDVGNSVEVDASGNIYTTGLFSGTIDFDPGPGVTNLTSIGLEDIFVTKVNSSGTLIWARSFGGINTDEAMDISADASGNIFITGYFYNTVDFDPGAGIYNLSSAGSSDVFVSKLNSSGDFVAAVRIGNTGTELGRSIEIDNLGNVIYTGSFENVVDFDPGGGTNNLVSAGGYDIFVSKLSSSLTHVWSQRMGGSGYDGAYAVTVDATNNVYTTGYFTGTADFDPGAPIANLFSSGMNDVFISKLTSTGSYTYVRHLMGAGDDIGYDIYFDNNGAGSIYITGSFGSTMDADPGGSVVNLVSAGASDAFLVKLDLSGNYIWGRGWGGLSTDISYSVSTDAIGIVYTSGSFSGITDFDPSGGTYNLISAGFSDAYFLKLSTGGTFIIAEKWGGNNYDQSKCIKVNSSYEVLNVGSFSTIADFDPNSGTINLTSVGGTDAFSTKHSICSNSLSTISVTSCGPYLSPSGNHLYTVSGNYMDTVGTNSSGCDSLVYIGLTINNSSNSSISPTVCGNYNSPSSNYNYTNSGIYYDTIPNHVGCDSIIQINLTVNQSSSNSINISACRTYTSPSGNYVWDQSATYLDTLTNQTGCDSIITINLSVTHIDTLITLSNGTFTVGQTGSVYQWFDCNSATAIPGETNQSFTPTTNGSYGALISLNGCTDTTACYTINNVGTEDISSASLNIYPNPAKEYVQVASGEIITQWKLVDITGKTVIARNENKTTFNISLVELTPGIYFIQLNIGASIIVKQLIIVE